MKAIIRYFRRTRFTWLIFQAAKETCVAPDHVNAALDHIRRTFADSDLDATPSEIMIAFAGEIARHPDGPAKIALAMKALGRHAPEMITMLNQLGQDPHAMV